MKQLSQTLAALLVIAPLTTTVYAAEEKAPMPPGHSMPGMGGMNMNMPQGQGGGMHGMGMGMMGGMTEEQQDQHMRMMQEHMLQMHELSDKILAAKDPQEKQKLKDQQLQMMKAHKMQMMKMMHPGMEMPHAPGAPQPQGKQPATK